LVAPCRYPGAFAIHNAIADVTAVETFLSPSIAYSSKSPVAAGFAQVRV